MAEGIAPADAAPEHPGMVLKRDFLDPLGLSANALALALRVPAPRVSELVRGRRGMTADTALRLGRHFGMAPEFWMGLQMAYDLERVRENEGARIDAEVAPLQSGGKAARKHMSKVVKRRTNVLKERMTG